MIYRKDANFPYPLLTNTSNSYKRNDFILDVNLQENSDDYEFKLSYELNSEFIIKLLENRQAQLFFIIQSKDNKFYDLDFGQKSIKISKTRISLSKRTTIQLLIQSKEEISFKENGDLNSFYQQFKNDIIVPKNSILGFSNIVTFEGSSVNPLNLFEKKVDPSIKSGIKIEFGTETIIINYRSEDLQFNDLPRSGHLNNTYIYAGLQKALYRFIVNNDEDGEQVDLDNIEPPQDGLDFKLYNLMKNKMVHELSIDNIDEVIYLITDKILERYAAAVRGVSHSGS